MGGNIVSVLIKPLKIMGGVYLLGLTGLAADVVTLTNFNILNFIKSHAPYSYMYISLSSLLLYFFLIIIELWKERRAHVSSTEAKGSSVTQSITTGNVENSSINQTGRR